MTSKWLFENRKEVAETIFKKVDSIKGKHDSPFYEMSIEHEDAIEWFYMYEQEEVEIAIEISLLTCDYTTRFTGNFEKFKRLRLLKGKWEK